MRVEEKERFVQVSTSDKKSYLFAKRVIDISFSLIALIVLSPFFLLISLLIKIEDPKGPVFFSQSRAGKNNKEFKMYKFRSMVSNAEELKEKLMDQNEAEGPVFKIKEDPRVTKVGKFIRRTSIDELPQLINILNGNMSLVGPRPPLPQEVAQYNSYEMQRLKVVPGLTCYWQVSGRSNLSFEEWVNLDIKYICNRNLFLDLKLILKTVKVLFGSKGAY
ncbi:sugar transferase [Halobacillus sp. BAB-2008]|uniref:sugar transferase n=1 Tax=Halobacillus sp. BAB-2008 TaxID=1246484 RepID=UPI001F49808F|nr:sugar transferase [Halobacillus sp. BAB-2008]